MALSWNEIKDRALAFSREWEGETSEHAEAKSFWDGFFNVFGVPRRRVATFEEPVKKHDGKGGYIDLLWKGVLLVEHKSAGKDLDTAFQQAKDYFPGIKDIDLPKYIVVSDFARIRLIDLEENKSHQFALKDFYKNVKPFGFIAGYQKHAIVPQDPINVDAVEKLGRLHDELEGLGYKGHELEILLVRLLFCLFAEDTSIFEKRQFQDFIENCTREDGSDLGARLNELFQYLNQPENERPEALDEAIAAFPYVNGRLYEETLRTAVFNRKMRDSLLECCTLDWSRISPAIFGSLFQSVMSPKERREQGAHYTTEENILKLIRPLFLDDLRAEFEKVRRNTAKLEEFHRKIAHLKFFDPACGCGNFLVIAYRELRKLELDVLKELYRDHSRFISIQDPVWCDVDQFYGVEINEFPARIAEVAMWLMDHQMNMAVSEEFGQYYRRLPLRKAATILPGNALTTEWSTVIDPKELNYLLGNPPFGGSKLLSDVQRREMEIIFRGIHGAGVMDYVAAWYMLAAAFLGKNPTIQCAFVSTNSITQGEQVGILWSELLRRGVRINFAHRTFRWSSEARGKAAVHCVIVGFGMRERSPKRIFDYETVGSEPQEVAAKNINPYLVDGPNLVLTSRSAPICAVPEIGIGNKPIDDGNYLFTREEKDAFIRSEPKAARWFRRWIGSDEFINGYERWCLWLGECPPHELRQMPEALKRVERVRKFRLESKSAPTRKLAETPTRFHVENIPMKPFLLVPKVSSERRAFIPVGFMQPETLCSDLVFISKQATLYHFGVLSSGMHMAWVRYTCGRLKSDYRYSKDIVYNNFPWPENPSEKAKAAIENAAQGVLNARAQFPEASLADLYDPLSMPAGLAKAHRALDAAVEAAYGRRSFASDAERVAFLFTRYEALVAPLEAEARKKKRRKARAGE